MANISKISVGGTSYDIKDAAVTAAVATKAERTEIKSIMDAFAVTAVPGVTGDYLLTIPVVAINQSTGALEVVTN